MDGREEDMMKERKKWQVWEWERQREYGNWMKEEKWGKSGQREKEKEKWEDMEELQRGDEARRKMNWGR